MAAVIKRLEEAFIGMFLRSVDDPLCRTSKVADMTVDA